MNHLSEQSGKSTLSTPLSALNRHVDRLYYVRELLGDQYAQRWTLGALSKQAGLSKSALPRGFRQRFGQSVFDYLHQRRMQRASELLTEENCSVTDAALAVGYEHPCDFSTAFRQYFGVTPKIFEADSIACSTAPKNVP